MSALTDAEMEMLEFERLTWTYPGAKESEIYDRFGCSATRYYQRLHVLIERPEALAHDGQLVNRLRRIVEVRRRRRRQGFSA